MCLYIDNTKTLEFDEEGWFQGWKVYRMDYCRGRGKQVTSVYRRAEVDITTNEIVAKGDLVRIMAQRGRVYEGIHVYTVARAAEAVWRNEPYGRGIVKVWGHKDDLIAVGDNNDAAFTKILIDEDAYQSILDEVYGVGKYTTEYCD